MAQAKPYRPSNGTDGEIFMSRMCADCALDCHGTEYEDGPFCEILAEAFAGGQPVQWIEDERGPRCTAFTLDPEAPAFDPAAAIGLLL
jgi:hypothetical protein